MGTVLMGLAVGFGNEIRKGMLNYLAGWRGTSFQLVLFPTFYLLVVLFMGRGEFRTDLLVPALIGTVPLAFLHEQVNRSFWSYIGDIQSGVLEQTYLTPVPSWLLIIARQAAAIAAALPLAVSTYLFGVVAVVARGGSVPFSVQIVVPMAAIAVGTVGLALLISGLTLVFKRVEILAEAALVAPFIVGGAYFPLSQLPGWVATLSRLLVPITPGVEAMRDILLDHRGLTTLHTGWGVGWLVVQPLLLVGLGAVLFSRLQAVARDRGTLGRY